IQTGARKIPGIISKIQSTAGAAATMLPGAFEAILLRNCSISTRKFYIRLIKTMPYNDLPLSLSTIIPPEIKEPLRNNIKNIEALDTALIKVIAPYIQTSLIIGLILMLVIILILLFSIYGSYYIHITKIPRGIYIAVHVIFSLIFYIPFSIPIAILYILRSNLDNLPSWIQVQYGDIYGLYIGCLYYAVAITTLGSIILIVY
ncbi:hypothetical protein B0T24DRAFT_532287, partial [Lasiosphaeria ovina]